MRTVLSYNQKKALETYLRSGHATFIAENSTTIEIAKKAAATLEFPISHTQVKALADECEIVLPRARNNPNRRLLNAPCDSLCRILLAQLYEKVGEPVPSELGDFLRASE